ncbi:coiled-coil domain-containing protein 22 homolog [Anoplophora glabripennis]|uniref:coiled-coil domain-containing protein 22 homolog n=1 Tax=Anoplophora glabripennis TaxID=217634 RepID=UPI0008759AA5|nr:coiled-coil domain-containing protein 22 homolog [Anoplophora glabripennis]
MDEVDKIIIDSLKHLECDFCDDIEHLKQFDADMVVSAISTCLEAVTPDLHLPKKLPPSMSARLNIASDLAQHIKNLGFRGDMGYQTILYCNEVEVRRVLMFLIERLPRETIKTIPIEQTGYVPRIVKKIEENVKNSLKQMWIPSSLLHFGIRECDGGYLVNSLGNSCPLQTTNLVIPDSKINDEALKEYWIHNIPDVTKQCPARKLIPSLLFKDNEFVGNPDLLIAIKNQREIVTVVEAPTNIKIDLSSDEVQKEITAEINIQKPSENKMDGLLKEVEVIKSQFLSLQEVIKSNELQLSQLRNMKSEEQEVLKDTLSKIKLKTKTLAVINKEENMAKLKNIVQNASDRLVELANQWNEVQTPLLDEYRSLQNTLTTEEIKLQEEQLKLNNAKETHQKLIEDLKEKSILEQSLMEKCQQMNRNNNRSAYTRRILEIIGNIRKQSSEIQKVLKDTKETQKEINSLTGQVDRSFTLSEELIFADAKHDETARRAYKLLATLRDECSSILKAVSDLGLAERESRNLQEQIETEKSKEVAAKLNRVYTDLEQIQKETQILLKQT